MRRRLDLAAALVHRPPVLFLDEPTTGLDPQGRTELWGVIEELVARRHDRAAHDAVPRGGRPPRRQHRRHRPRARDRRGHGDRAQGPARRDHRRGRLRRRGQRASARAACSRALGSCDVEPDGRHRRVQGRTTARRVAIDVVRTLDGEGLEPGDPRVARADPRRRVPRRSPATRPRSPNPTTRSAPAASAPEVPHDRRPAHRPSRRRRERPQRSAFGWAVADTMTIAWRNLLTITRAAAAARVLDRPADHLRADVPLRVRRRDQDPERRPTSTT